MRNSFLKLSFILALAVASTSYSFAAAKFNGNISFYSSGNLVGYNIPQIYNTSSTYSTGTLAMYVVGTYAPYYGVGLIYGTELYASLPYDGLYPSYVYNNDSGVVAFSDAPANYTYLWVGLYEYNGFEYALSDYQNILVSTYFPAPVISHWMPEGWVYYAWPYAYSISEGRWHFFNEPATQWRVNLSNSQWGKLSEARGWNYYAWPYSYSIDQSTWHWYNADLQWVVDLVTGIWETLGSSED